MRLHERVVNHGSYIFASQLFDFIDFVGGAKSIKEVQNRQGKRGVGAAAAQRSSKEER